MTGQKDLPHFGHLTDELFRQEMLPVMRLMMSRGKLKAYQHWTLSEKLSRVHDPETYDILLTLSRQTMTNKVETSGEEIDALSVVSLGHYLSSTNYHDRLETHLLAILRLHGHPSVRAFAAEALHSCNSTAAVKALEEATKDQGRVVTPQGPYDSVAEYAEESLRKIRNGR